MVKFMPLWILQCQLIKTSTFKEYSEDKYYYNDPNDLAHNIEIIF